MLLNRDSKPWLWVCLAIFVVCTVAYVPYHRSSINGPSGGTWPGLIYGVIGTAMIFLAMALTPRKKFRTLRIGRTYWWLQAHVWFGLLSFPVILYHAGFREGLWGGWITVTLMVLFIIIEISGITGLILQNVLPGKLLRDVQFETIFEQIDHVVGELAKEAKSRVEAVTARKVEGEFDYDAIPAGSGLSGPVGSGTAVAAVPTAGVTAATTPGAEEVERFYRTQVVPALGSSYATAALPADFDRLRSQTPLSIHELINDLQSIVDERRQLERQRKTQYLLHGWLWVHVPLSMAMLVLIVVHAVVALRYARPW
jgi:hypothetical protein